MNWSAALYAVTIWMIAASLWQMYQPLPESMPHRDLAVRVFRDVSPAILLGVLIGRIV